MHARKNIQDISSHNEGQLKPNHRVVGQWLFSEENCSETRGKLQNKNGVMKGMEVHSYNPSA
jgi:hypothetical protein